MPTFPRPLVPTGNVPIPVPRPVSAPVTARPAPVAQTTGEALTLDALMARQKEAVAREGQNLEQPVTNIPQGLGQLGWTLVNALQERRAGKDLEQGNADVAGAFQQMDPATGQLPPDAMSTLMQRNPELGVEMYKTAMALKASQAKQEQWDPIPTPQGENGQWFRNATTGETKKVGGGTESGAWKPTDIAARADDYMKASASYNQAAPSWQSMQEAAGVALNPKTDVSGRGTADYNMIVAFAKLLDPNSVVREGEVKSASMTEGMLNQIQGMLNSWTSNGMLDDATRRAIMTQGQSRVKSYYDQAKQYREWIAGVATRHGVDPNDVVPPLADFVPWEEAKPQEDPNTPVPDDTTPGNLPYPGQMPDGWPADIGWPSPEAWKTASAAKQQAILDIIKKQQQPPATP